jgi:hypothetical protein
MEHLFQCSLDLLLFSLDLLSSLLKFGNSLETHLSSTPLTNNIVVELSTEVLLKSAEFGVILFVDRGQSNNSSVLLVNKSAKTTLSLSIYFSKTEMEGKYLDNGVWNVHLSAEGWKPDDQFNWVNIVSNNNKVSLLLLDQGGDMLQTKLDNIWSIASGGSFPGSLGLGEILKTLSLGSLGLWLVLNKKLEQFSGLVLVKSLLELSNDRRNLQTLKKNLKQIVTK